jgi:hypothetical protein
MLGFVNAGDAVKEFQDLIFDKWGYLGIKLSVFLFTSHRHQTKFEFRMASQFVVHLLRFYISSARDSVRHVLSLTVLEKHSE